MPDRKYKKILAIGSLVLVRSYDVDWSSYS